ncbi:hypothetical protein UFOVP223_7 [uncultured Caudovirales phage]|uniref:Uncharacterized protein n=1 Tax=uncultured Caudovirales phage TaxID=2100421 RepID=A0A6J7WM38_9CAUD|nr:hypothetical protein UFOVP110_23 [uncultured Caudovirales phage]CAB5218896.1 hypothetical protein UFOVP223_7 [uncultured Caudovirales phage]
MAHWADQGHAMRRRSGAPSNHHEQAESVGQEMAERNHSTSDEAYGAASASGSHRIPMGMDAYQVSATPALKGTLVPKKNVQAGDPTAGGKVNRQNIEVLGASYRVAPKATFVQIDPAAGPTMRSAKIVPSIAGRANPNFQGGEQASYI